MNHDLDSVTVRWQRRNADQVFRFMLFAEFTVGDMLPGTMVYDRLRFAIANQQLVHAIRNELGRFIRWATPTRRER